MPWCRRDEPELNAVDLPLLNPDIYIVAENGTLCTPEDICVRSYNGNMASNCSASTPIPLRCFILHRPFAGLKDIIGRKVRTSSVGQSEMMSALGAIPVVTPFSDIVGAIKSNVVDCAITGYISGNQIGLPDVTSYIYPMAISWRGLRTSG